MIFSQKKKIYVGIHKHLLEAVQSSKKKNIGLHKLMSVFRLTIYKHLRNPNKKEAPQGKIKNLL